LFSLHLANLTVPCGPLIWNQKAPNREYSNHLITDTAGSYHEPDTVGESKDGSTIWVFYTLAFLKLSTVWFIFL
jgi:hypothetical protein